MSDAGGRETAGHIRKLQRELAQAAHDSEEKLDLTAQLAIALLERYEDGSPPLGGTLISDLDAVIGYCGRFLSFCRGGGDPEIRFVAAVAHYYRFDLTEDGADLDAAAAHLAAVTAGRELADLSVEVLKLLADTLAARCEHVPLSDPAHISEAIRVNLLLRDLLPETDPARFSCVDNLARLWAGRYYRNDPAAGLADLSGAIECLRWLRLAAARGDAALPEVTIRLGTALADRALRRGNAAADVDEAIAALAAACRLLAADEPFRSVAVTFLGIMLGVRFATHRGRPADRAAALARLREALADRGLADPGLATDPALAADLMTGARLWLGQVLLIPVIPGGHAIPAQAGAGPLDLSLDLSPVAAMGTALASDEARADAAEAIGHLHPLIESSAGDPETAASVSMLLGNALMIRGAEKLSAAELDQVISCWDRADRHLASAGLRTPEVTAIRAWLLAERIARTDFEADGQPALQALSRARDDLPREHPLRPVTLYLLARMLAREFGRQPSREIVSAAVDALTEALPAMGQDHPVRTDALVLLAASLLSMVQYDAAAVPVRDVVEMLAVAETQPSADPAQQAVRLTCYGTALHLQAIQERQYGRFRAALARACDAADLMPADHAQRSFVLVHLASMLAGEYQFVGNLESLDAAQFHLSEALRLVTAAGGPAYNPAATDRCMIWAVRGDVRLHLGTHREDPALAEAAIADLESAVAAYPAEHPFRPRLASQLSSARMLRSLLARDLRGMLAAGHQVVLAARGLPEDSPDRGPLLARAAMMWIARARTFGSPHMLDQAIELLTEAADLVALTPEQRPRAMAGLGQALLHRFELAGDPADLNRGIACLQGAARDFAGRPGYVVSARVLATLARAYRARANPDRGDPRAAVAAGLGALREQAGDVLLQSSAERALVMARLASAQSAEVAGWALDAGLPALAVEALELGRGLVLHAATVVTSLADRLRATGRGELAAEWDCVAVAAATPRPAGAASAESTQPWEEEAAAAGPDGALAVPSDLRYRVLAALRGTELDRLLDPPAVAEIAAAVAATGRDALVYLLRTGNDDEGQALIIRAGGSVSNIALPQLAGPEADRRMDEYATAQQEALRADGDEQARATRVAAWESALTHLCAWSWPVAIGPILRRLKAGDPQGPVRVTLIPCGKLAVVPWHAARTAGAAGSPRFALQDAVFTYAAAGRQFVDAARRERLAAALSPVIVTDPASGDIRWATREARAIRAAWYPAARFLGSRRSGAPATCDSVLERLPARGRAGASLLHVSCHAMAAASPELSYLRLPRDSRLLVSAVLRQAQGRSASAPGGLVVLSACMSDLTTRDYDEALTLATAFLAAGAVSVVGSRWQVPDIRTALLMFMFHHYLAGGQPPGDALRSAQLWMLDPRRRQPGQMPDAFARHSQRPDLGREASWAAFAYQGQ